MRIVVMGRRCAVNPWRDVKIFPPDGALDRIEIGLLGFAGLGQGRVVAMMRAGSAVVLGLGMALGGEVAAQTYTGMASDTILQGVIAEMTAATQATCRMGLQLSCDHNAAILRNVEMMRLADAACQTGNQQACTYFVQAYEQMGRDYTQFSQIYVTMIAPVSDPNNPLGATHDDRMRRIAEIGQQNTADWQSRIADVQRNHERYMTTLQ